MNSNEYEIKCLKITQRVAKKGYKTQKYEVGWVGEVSQKMTQDDRKRGGGI